MSPSPDDYDKFVRPTAAEELHQHSPLPVVLGTDPTDGLPAQVTPRNFDKSPPLTEDTLVCMADQRSFVIRNVNGYIKQAFASPSVRRLPNGDYCVEADRLTQLTQLEGLFERRNEGGLSMATVEPIRPACVHYIRMQTDLAADREARYIVRACAMQRDETGEYYSVRDSLISACTLRAPRHYESEQLLDVFDADKIAQAKIRLEEEAFDIDQALEAEKTSSTSGGGKLGILG